ncbi:MAG: NAD-binding protein [Thermodesulfobacteriota bacterium]
MPLNRLTIAIIYCLGIICFGTAGYMTLEGYNFLEALYMTVITITTVGFGEVIPLSASGRIFTVVLIIIGLIGLAYAGHSIAESLLEQMWSRNSEIKKMQTRIGRLQKHYIICGYGRVGQAAAHYFSKLGIPIVIIEFSDEACEKIKEHDLPYVQGDATLDENLLNAGIKRASGLLALLHSDPLNLFTTLTARELNPTLRIISRSAEFSAEQKILKAGADSVVCPHVTAGKHIAENILSATGHMPEKIAQPITIQPQWVKIKEGSSMADKLIGELAAKMGREIIGLRRGDQDFIYPDPVSVLKVGDKILILEEGGQEEELVEATPQKIVIVDDNPVIVHLYARLFQKAGFIPLTASDGEQGLAMILEEKPDAAVIDFMLPELSGIEVVEKVRKVLPYPIKLIVFTANEQDKTRKDALAAGADQVVVKSPEAAEVIDTVVQLIRPQS